METIFLRILTNIFFLCNHQIFDGLLDGGGATTLIDIDFVATTAWTDSSEDDEVLQSFAPIVTEPPSDETTWNILNRMLMWYVTCKEIDSLNILNRFYQAFGRERIC